MKTIITIAIVALLSSPMYVEARNTKVSPGYNSAPASTEVESTPTPQAPESPRSGGHGGSSKSALLEKIEMLKMIIALLEQLKGLQG